MRLPITLLALALSTAALAAPPKTVDDALAQAKKAHQPVFLDFSAPWCYSCYFMATHVLNGAEWKKLEARAIVAEIDADSPDGAEWMKKLQVKALPAYVVLNDNGNELGRILAEQPREKFYPEVNRILDNSHTLDQLKAAAATGKTDAIADVLNSYVERGDGNGGFDWFAKLQGKVRDDAAKDKKISLELDRLTLARAMKSKDYMHAIPAAKRALANETIGCDRPYVIDDLLAATENVGLSQRRALLAPEKPALDTMLAKDIFIAKPKCADQRSAVIATADLDAAIGDTKAETDVLDHAIKTVRAQVGNNLRKDRNAADNLRVYLVRAKKVDELDALYPKLIAAYPDDYVYPYRWGRSLVERDKPKEALPLLEKAAEKAYGENRLVVATFRVKALKALHREQDAQKVVADTLEQNGKWFPEEVEKLKAALKS
jgi:thiol-disulfide isomerase/thioredoxin